MGFRVREGSSADVPEMEAVYQRSWKGAYESMLDPTTLDTMAAERAASFDWMQGISAPDSHVLVADNDGEIVGVAQAIEDLEPPRDLPEVLMLYVDPQHWGQGVATVLLAAELRWLAERGHRHARLRVVQEHGRARRFYEREGWRFDDTMAPVSTGLATVIYYRRPTADEA